jgi:GNAT superfamily N-acetyltransferase
MTLTDLRRRLQRETTNDTISRREAMNGIAVRDASRDDVEFIVQMIRRMLADMASYGGYAPATDEDAWQKMTGSIGDAIQSGNTRYMIAESTEGEPFGVAGAELITLGGAFAPHKTIHIHVVYVLPALRRKGIASALLARALDWGRAAGCQQCTLNVLYNNPAKALYAKSGFAVFELKLVRSLQSGD